MTTTAAAGGGGLGYRPGLDGIRGLSIAGVLLFHAGLPFAAGGFLGVSTFYTLSGFLITSLLLEERARSGGVALDRFFGRRARRLLPAALAGLLAVAATAPLFADPSQLARLRGDVPWALGYALNWRLIAENASYALLFSEPSPVQHFWSLAIEAQFYLVLPLVLLPLARLRNAAGRAAVFAGLALASAGGSAWLTAAGATGDRIYYGSDTRAAELLVGCALAALWSDRRGGGDVSRSGLARGAGGLALAVTVGSWFATSLDSAWLYRGGLGGYALLSAALVVASLDESSPVGRLLRWSPLVFLGRVSYGLYVYHWPVFLALSPERLGLGEAGTFAVRVAVSVALAWASERWIERPIRRGSRLAGRAGVLAAGAACALVVAVLIPNTRGAEALSFRDDGETSVAPGDARARVAFFGDSTMLTLMPGLRRWLDERGAGATVQGVTRPGCGLAEEGRTSLAFKVRDIPPICAARPRDWAEALEAGDVDLAVVMVGPWDVRARQLPGEEPFRKLGDPDLDAVVRAEIVAAVDLLASRGAAVVWLTAPRFAPSPERAGPLHRYGAEVDRFNELLAEVQRSRADRMQVVDLAAWMGETEERHLDSWLRQDGVHYTVAGAERIASEWLGPRLLEAWARLGTVGADRRSR